MQKQHNKRKKIARKAKQNENRKRKTLDLNESLEYEVFVNEFGEAVTFKKIKKKGSRKKILR